MFCKCNKCGWFGSPTTYGGKRIKGPLYNFHDSGIMWGRVWRLEPGTSRVSDKCPRCYKKIL